MRSLVLLLLSCCTVLGHAESPFAGQWTINYEETDKVAVKYKDGSGMRGSNFKPQVTIMGIPLPGSSRARGNSSLSAKNPKVLRCTTMQIDVAGGRIVLDYDTEGDEELRKGHFRGRDTQISRKRIRQKYETSQRKVTKTWSIRDDGRLLVSVKLNPKGDKSRTYNRVFDRVVPGAAKAEEAAVETPAS